MFHRQQEENMELRGSKRIRLSEVSQQQSKNSMNKKKKKTVTFNDSIQRIEVCYYVNPKKQLYSPEEIQKFRSKAQLIVKLLQKGYDPNSLEFYLNGKETTRGLEYAQPSINRIRKLRKIKASNAVIVTQQSLRNSQEEEEEEAVAEAYRNAFDTAQKDAEAIALRDEQFVIDYIRGPSTTTSDEKRRRNCNNNNHPSRPEVLSRQQGKKQLISLHQDIIMA